MLKATQAVVTPGKLLEPPKAISCKQSSAPVPNISALPSRTPKIFSSYKPPLVPARSRPEKPPITDLPLFLCEYLNCPERKSSSIPTKKSVVAQTFRNRAKTPNTLLFDTKITERSPRPKSPAPQRTDLFDTRSSIANKFYKPHFVKISPRAGIKLSSSSPFSRYPYPDSHKKHRKKNINLSNSVNVEKKKENEQKVLPVFVNEYTKTFAGKLRRVLEISEAAKNEADLLINYY